MMDINKLITDNIDVWTNALSSKTAKGRGSSKKIDFTGIKSLRNLILELAVQGKLIKVDNSGVNTQTLLEQILDAKKELIKQKKLKKQKSLPSLSEEEILFQAPKGWIWTRLGEVTNYGVADKAEPTSVDDDCWVLELEDVEKSTSRLLKRVRFSERNFKSSKNRFVSGDVIYGKLRPYLDKIIVADEAGVCTTEMIPFRAYANLDSRFLRLIMKTPYFINYANNSTHGMNLPRMGTDKARLAPILIAPIEEQKLIVKKVDELMALCDQLERQSETSIDAHRLLVEELLSTLFLPAEGSNSESAQAFEQNWARIAEHFDLLFTTEHSIEQLKQTILQLAVMGKLVSQDPTDEPASKLLERIAQEKEQLIKDKVIKRQKPLPNITDEEKAFDLPCGWEWAKLDYLALKSGAGWSPQCNGHPKVGNNWGVLKVSAISWGEYNPDENKELPVSLEPRPDLEVKSGDFLISRANTAELVAKAVVVPENSPERLMMSDKIIRFNFSPLISLDYIKLINNSRQSRTYYAAVAGGTSSSMKNVSREQIRNLVFAIPSTNEQLRIIAKFNELLAICEQLKASIIDAKATQVHLAEAIVEQALN